MGKFNFTDEFKREAVAKLSSEAVRRPRFFSAWAFLNGGDKLYH